MVGRGGDDNVEDMQQLSFSKAKIDVIVIKVVCMLSEIRGPL